jgi:hypothetical protein
MNNFNNKADTHYLKQLPSSPIPTLPEVDTTENNYQPNWHVTIVLNSITAMIGIHL